MSTQFQCVALPFEPFAHLFEMEDAELHALGARRMVVEEKPGTPCRVSLEDAEVGETVLLVPFTHHDVPSPYRASGPIFVRRRVRRASFAPGEVPLLLRHRLLSLRGYDRAGMMMAAEVVPGPELESSLWGMLSLVAVDYVHVHHAGAGCFACRVERA
ncbi:MAG TPA: DUF1203 domain-containing protein [Candidatus Polarisedimenticolaceae bacterium]|nr:DUF1203 domain-containing protein [Candidatus Polarisedimenticolaceae bacterium]